ncbi:MAG: rmd 1 [Acidobacteria bacterium]|nr:rmd 1 [Acidobacteriota bacterium]
MKRVLVTGASGFIGRAVVPLLAARGFEVERYRGDLLADDPTAAIGAIRPTHLLHLAWYAVPGDYRTSPLNLQWLDASKRLVDAFVAAGGERAVIAGTCAEYDWSGGVCSEQTTPIAPRDIYGESKDALRRYVEALDCSSAWGRIFFLYGPHEHSARLVPSLIRSMLAGEVAICRQPALRRDFLHVDDVAAAFAMLLDSDARGPINVGSGDALSLGDIAKRIARLTGGQISFGGGSDGDQAELVVADNARLRALGFAPAIGLERGLRETIAWWRASMEVPA